MRDSRVYGISAAVRVDYRELQGCLPQFNPMQVQDLQRLASSLLQAPDLPAPSASVKTFKYLPLHWLDPFVRVDTQFSGFKVTFESAIAFHPSNPRFYRGDRPLALMSPDQGKTLKINIASTVNKIEIWLVGGKSIMATALNEAGQCVAIAQTPDSEDDKENCQLYPRKVTLETGTAKVVHLDSTSPFMLTRLGVELA